MYVNVPQYFEFDGARVSPESAMGKELARWNGLRFNEHTKQWERLGEDYDPRKNQFPKMLYRAQHRPDGRRSAGEVLDSVCGGYAGAAEQFSRQCQMTVGDESEMKRAFESGWREHPSEALAYLEARDNDVSTATAERHFKDARMGEKAQREADRADQAAGLKHLPELPSNTALGTPKMSGYTPEKRAAAAEKRKATLAAKKAQAAA